MLKSITLDNYTTFFSKTSIDFAATNYKFLEKENVGDGRILKGALFIGENASGKTKIIEAIKFLLDLLFDNNVIDFTINKSFYTKNPSYKLEYEFLVSNSLIKYFIELAPDKIISEKLYLNNETIFERLGTSAKLYFKDEKTFDDISSKLLFLRRIYFDTHFYNDEILNQWFNYLKNSIYINCYTRDIECHSDNNLSIYNYLNEHDIKEINNFFEKINYNQKIEYATNNSDPKNLFKVNAKEKFISFNKLGTDVYIPEIFESTGNITLVQILPSFLHAIKNDCMIILDEFSSGFHNELEECLIKYFFHYSKNSQIFFASHSTNLLNNTILRPDQIYSVTFNAKKGSVLKRFSEEMPRESQNTEKMYLNGVFDGMPRYNKFFKD